MIILLIANLIVASILDIKRGEVPIWLTLSMVIEQVIFLVIVGILKNERIILSLVAAVIIFLVFRVAMQFFTMGGADVLTATAIGVCFGIWGFAPITLGLIAAIPFAFIKKKNTYPLIPFLSAGTIVYLVILLITGWEINFLI